MVPSEHSLLARSMLGASLRVQLLSPSCSDFKEPVYPWLEMRGEEMVCSQREVDTGSPCNGGDESGGAEDGDGLELSLSLGGSSSKSHGVHESKASQYAETMEERASAKEKERFSSLKSGPWVNQEEAVSNFLFQHCEEYEEVDWTGQTAVRTCNAIQKTAAMPEKAVPASVCNWLEGVEGGDHAQVSWLPASTRFMETLKERNDCVPFMESTVASASDRPQQTLETTSANLDSWQDKSFDSSLKAAPFIQQRQQESIELQSKKELQARRHQEARKRRKTLIEEKQLKRQRKLEGRLLSQIASPISTQSKCLSTSLTVQGPSSPRNCESGRLQLTGSNRWVQIQKAQASVTIGPRDDEEDSTILNNLTDKQLRLFGFTTCHKSDSEIPMDLSDRSGRRIAAGDGGLGVCHSANPHLEATTPVDGCDSSARMEHGLQTGRMMKADQTFSGVAIHNSLQFVKPKGIIGAWVVGDKEMAWQPVKVDSFEEGKDGRSICEDSASRSESRSKKNEQGKMEMESGDVEARSRTSASLPLALSTLQPCQALTSTPPPCEPYSFPSLFHSMSYPALASAATPSDLSLQMGFPYNMQFPSPLSTCQHNPNSVDGPNPGASGASSSNGTLTHDRGSSNEAESNAAESQSTLTSLVEGWSSSRKSKNQLTACGALPSKPKLPTLDHTSLKPLALVGANQTIDKSGEKPFQRERQRSIDSSAALRYWEMPTMSSQVEQKAQLAQSFCGGQMEREDYAEGSKFGCDQAIAQVTPERCNSSGDKSNGVPIDGFDNKTSNLHRSSFPEPTLVSTTGSGPNGKTVNGVMYILNKNQVMIVCTCHGEHLSTSEFVQHAGGTNLSNPERSILVNPFSYVRQLASATG